MLDWFEFDPADPSALATLVAGLPVDDGALAVVVEPLLPGGAPEPGLLDRLRGRADEVGAVALALVRKYEGGSRGQPHALIELHFPADDRAFSDRVGDLPGWLEIDEGRADRALLAAPLTVDASDVARFVLTTLSTLCGPLAGQVWRLTETDGHRAAELVE